MAANPLIFKDAEKARNEITKKQKKEIEALYKQWADEIAEQAEFYKNKETASSVLRERQLRQLKDQLQAASEQISEEVEEKIKDNIYLVSDSVVKSNARWLIDLGFSKTFVNVAFSSVPDNTVRLLVTGKLYEGGWNLSSKIWGSNEKTLQEIYRIVAGGMAKNESVYEIAKKLERYVKPGAKKQWNLRDKDGRLIYSKNVDYSAQRLARTLIQHGYQQSFVATTQKNPFITEYIWSANGSRACPLCKDRDGQRYGKNELPLDHPNGMCTMIPDVSKTMVNDLAEWFNAPVGTYPEIDSFAELLGYEL